MKAVDDISNLFFNSLM